MSIDNGKTEEELKRQIFAPTKADLVDETLDMATLLAGELRLSIDELSELNFDGLHQLYEWLITNTGQFLSADSQEIILDRRDKAREWLSRHQAPD